jgi:uncharacterized protein
MDGLTIVYALVCVGLAAVVRGYSGFGFSLLTITSLSLVMPARQIVPVIFILEVAASLHLLPGIWRDVHWRSLAPLLFGCLLATPIGTWLLASMPVGPMQIALGIFVLIATLLLLAGFALRAMPGRFLTTLTGAASGLANGAFGIGGPPVVLFYVATPAGIAAGRASLIVFFLCTDLIGLGFLAREGLVTIDTAKHAAILAPALFLGVAIGARSFKGSDPAMFRRFVLVLLGALALATIVQGVLAVR